MKNYLLNNRYKDQLPLTIVYSRGPCPSRWMMIGEAPGRTEAKLGQPFIGKSGDAQEVYLRRHGIPSSKIFYITNVVKTYIEGNPDPTPELIDHWTPYLIDEIYKVNPDLIVAVGRFAAQWLLGEGVELETCHGLPYDAGFYDESRSDRAPSKSIIIPIYHPASGFYRVESRSYIDWDYKQVCNTINRIKSGEEILVPRDYYHGIEQYWDFTGQQVEEYLERNLSSINIIGIDTEGFPGNWWSVQGSIKSGTGFCLRTRQPDFARGVRAIQRVVDSGVLIATHDAGTPSGCCYDYTGCLDMGIDLTDANSFNTMTALFHLRLESRGLKAAAERFLRAKMEDYESLLGDLTRQKQVDYLREIVKHKWSPPKHMLVEEKGEDKLTKPKSIESRVAAIIRDVESGKVNKDGKVTDPKKRWFDTPEVMIEEVEKKLGPMPVATLDDVDLSKAVFYACRDADMTRRLVVQ